MLRGISIGFASLLLAGAASAEIWLSCETQNSHLFPSSAEKPPYLEITGSRRNISEGIIRSGREVRNLNCSRNVHEDPGIVTCLGIRVTGPVLLTETVVVATDQENPLAVVTSALIGEGALLAPATTSRVALNCSVNAFQGIMGSKVKPSNDNSGLILKAK